MQLAGSPLSGKCEALRAGSSRLCFDRYTDPFGRSSRLCFVHAGHLLRASDAAMSMEELTDRLGCPLHMTGKIFFWFSSEDLVADLRNLVGQVLRVVPLSDAKSISELLPVRLLWIVELDTVFLVVDGILIGPVEQFPQFFDAFILDEEGKCGEFLKKSHS